MFANRHDQRTEEMRPSSGTGSGWVDSGNRISFRGRRLTASTAHQVFDESSVWCDFFYWGVELIRDNSNQPGPDVSRTGNRSGSMQCIHRRAPMSDNVANGLAICRQRNSERTR